MFCLLMLVLLWEGALWGFLIILSLTIDSVRLGRCF
jgi:hypothetical protein